jgi:hypothetical protein
MILLAHVKKTDKPTLNDIRDSSGIAQEADYVFILERLLETTKTVDERNESGNLYSQDTRLTLAKNRLTGITPRLVINLNNGRLQEKYDMGNIPEIEKTEIIPENDRMF